MPNRARWHLQYPASSIADLNLLRRHYETLRADQHVAEATLTDHYYNSQIRLMEVVFREPWDQPLTPELYFLDQRYLPVWTSMSPACPIARAS